jgi:FixJ family two-component response regulator
MHTIHVERHEHDDYRTAVANTITYGRGPASEPEAKPTVFVLDDDVSVRESLELLIQSCGWQSETFATAGAFLARPPASAACCLILDLVLPDMRGLDVQSRVSTVLSGMPVICISGHADVPTSVRAMKAGAIEFLTKPFDNDVMIGAIERALQRSRLALEHEGKMCELRRRYAALTPREREVMALVASGLLNKQAAGELGISEITVKAHRGQVMRKMKADSLPALVKMVLTLRLLQ